MMGDDYRIKHPFAGPPILDQRGADSMNKPTDQTECPTCGSAVRVVGDVTMHYEPEGTMTDDARERVAAVPLSVANDENYNEASPRDAALIAADRILRALRDSEGREVVAEGWIYDGPHVPRQRPARRFFTERPSDDSCWLPVALIRRQEANLSDFRKEEQS